MSSAGASSPTVAAPLRLLPLAIFPRFGRHGARRRRRPADCPHQPLSCRGSCPSPPSSDPDSDAGADGHTRCIHRLLSFCGSGGRCTAAAATEMQFHIPKAERSKIDLRSPFLDPNPRFLMPLRSAGDEMTERLERKRQRVREAEPEPEPPVPRELVSAIQLVEDRFSRLEQMRTELAREMEMLWMERGLSRSKLLLESRRSIVDAFDSGLSLAVESGELSLRLCALEQRLIFMLFSLMH